MKKTQFILLLIAGLFISCNKTQKFSTFDDYPVYEGSDLEFSYSAHSSRFRVWAPTASAVKILLYDQGFDGGAYQTLDMDKSEQGTWLLKVDENLKGKFYTFQVRIGERWLDETPGMWVKATGINGKRAAIIDFAQTNPAGWENDIRPPLKNFTDINIYEVHVRDFSISASSGIKNKGKFLAFTEHGTHNAEGESTGIDHLKALGITHVLLLPVSDCGAIDEARLFEKKHSSGQYPVNYNVPEGSFSTNPTDPLVRIREFKQMVQSLHKAGIRVIMDVVYNHTSVGKGSHLDLLAPGYFYRQNVDSTWSNASSFGNETASERGMMRKFMVESVVYWATEYHVDGFRFDQMGIHDIETMNEIRAAADKIDPTIFLSGVGSAANNSSLAEDRRALKKNAKQLNNIAVFGDDMCSAIAGSSKLAGFIIGTDSVDEDIRFGVVAGTQHPQIDYAKLIYSKIPFVNNPTQLVNYLTRYSEKSLIDKVNDTKPLNATDDELLRFYKLAQTIVFTSQGIPFITGGQELYYNPNSARTINLSSDSIHQIDWSFKSTHKEMFDYYKGLIALRKEHAAFRIPTQDMIQNHLKFLSLMMPNVVGYMLKDHVNNEIWKDILVLINGNRAAVKVNIPLGQWNVVCHDSQINLNGISQVNDSSFVVAASSASILYTK